MRGRRRSLRNLCRRCALVLSVCSGLLQAATLTAQSSDTKNEAAFRDLTLRAASARDAGDITVSVHLYQEAVHIRPAWQEGWWYLGSLEYDGNHYTEAISSLRRLTALNPKMSAAWALLGLSEFETQSFPQAFVHLQRAHRLGDPPELAKVTDYHLALLLNLQGEFEAGQSLLEKLVAQGVLSEDVQVGLGLSILRVPLLPSQLDASKDALIHEAGSAAGFAARKEYEQSNLTFQDLLKKYPSTPFAHYAYGAMLAARGQDADAEAQFQQETKVTPESGVAYMEWGFLELKAQHYATALPLGQTAVRLAPHSFMAHYLLGSVLLNQGEIASSIPQLETARRLAPGVPEIRYSLARAYAKTGRRKEARREQAEFLRLQSRAGSARNAGGEEAEPSSP